MIDEMIFIGTKQKQEIFIIKLAGQYFEWDKPSQEISHKSFTRTEK